MTFEDLATRLGISPGDLEAWEAAKVACSDYPRLLELAMEVIEYQVSGPTDEEFAELQQCIEQVIGPATSSGAHK